MVICKGEWVTGSFKIDGVNDLKSGICEKFSHATAIGRDFVVWCKSVRPFCIRFTVYE